MSPDNSHATLRSDIPSDDIFALYRAYDSMFEVLKVNTPAMLEDVYRLRYQIYCVENPFEKAEDNPNGLEIDQYDDHSEHYLLIHRASKLPVGTVRMILPRADAPEKSFPIQTVCDLDELTLDAVPRATEISRFCISQEIRKRIEDTTMYSGVFAMKNNAHAENVHKHDVSKKRVIYHAALGLMRATLDSMQSNNVENAYLICEPALQRILGKLGVCTTSIGPMIDYHGRRQPVRVRSREVLANTKEKYPEIWAVLSDNGRLPIK